MDPPNQQHEYPPESWQTVLHRRISPSGQPQATGVHVLPAADAPFRVSCEHEFITLRLPVNIGEIECLVRWSTLSLVRC
jgi:hypothetical protein